MDDNIKINITADYIKTLDHGPEYSVTVDHYGTDDDGLLLDVALSSVVRIAKRTGIAFPDFCRLLAKNALRQWNTQIGSDKEIN